MTNTEDLIRQLDRDNMKQDIHLRLVPAELWPVGANTDTRRVAVYRSRRFLVQVFDEPHALRLSINRTKMRPDGRWEDGITWVEIQDIKREIGLGEMYAVEIYPRDADIVDVANMRHIWVLPEPLIGVGWRNE